MPWQDQLLPPGAGGRDRLFLRDMDVKSSSRGRRSKTFRGDRRWWYGRSKQAHMHPCWRWMHSSNAQVVGRASSRIRHADGRRVLVRAFE